MNSFFILGRVPELSLLEIEAVLKTDYPNATLAERGSEAVVVSGDLPTPELIARLGGSIKGGRVNTRNDKDLDAATQYIVQDLVSRAQNVRGKVTYGISAYSVSQKTLKGNEARRIHAWIQKTGIAIKRMLREQEVSTRFVAPQIDACALSSVVVTKNHLIASPNCEYVLLIDDTSLAVGTTEAVQDFEAYSYRDYHRPRRDMKTGLLPPKLARMMINLTGVKKDGVILDPFCGLGTVLQEAVLLGYTNMRGSDVDEKNVQATQQNLDWLLRTPFLTTGQRKLLTVEGTARQCDARNLASCFPDASIDAISTEPTLGPALSVRHPTISTKEIADLCNLYIASFRSFQKVLKPSGRVVIVFPVWVERDENHTFIPCVEDIRRLGFHAVSLRDDLYSFGSGLRRNDRPSILIAREDSRVARELFVFKKR